MLEKPLQYKNNEITEFLWYGCPHCYAVNPIILQWEQDKKLTHTLVQKHSQLSERFMFDANVFYGLQLIDKTELRQEYFDKRQQGQFKSTKDINNWIQSKGINQDQFFNALKAPKLIAEREQTLKEERSTGSTGVPAFIVEGKYIVLVRGLSKIGGWKAVPGLINYLSALDGK
ncbi:DsbA family protein [Psychromonas sp. SP041]|uniref:DsbA family protein n=1 Tax=Psychromonas sp. SP041 TaxID=1365007 RepID=UPI001484F697|nr:DsbA family protein [Psychromonas sp. SP041]